MTGFIRLFHRLPVIVLIALLSLVIRFLWLDKVPTGISSDELGFIINAKALFLTGSDISGKWSPFSLTPVAGEFPQAEIPYLLLAPVVGILPFSLFTARLPFAVINTLLIVLLYLLTSRLIDKRAAFIVGLVGAFNPWSIFFGRTAYEAPIAIFFYILALYILIIARGWKILLAFIPFFIAFYSYMGTKITFVPLVFFVTAYSWLVVQKRKYFKQYMVLLGLSFALFLFFIVQIQHQSTKSRLSELATPGNPAYASVVNNERKLSVRTPLTNMYSNKYVVYGKDLIEKYLKVFSTNFQFLNGEGRSTFSLWYHGYFYYLDFLFLVIGFSYLFAKKRNAWILLSGLLFMAPFAAVASNVETGFAALRGSLLYPVFIILIGVGLWYVTFLFRKKVYRFAVISVLTLAYGILILNFMNIYFFRNPVYNSEAFLFSDRLLSKYVRLAGEQGKEVVIISSNPKARFFLHMFYSDYYNKDSANEIRDIVNQNAYSYKNAHFVHCSDLTDLRADSIYITDAISDCRLAEFNAMKNNSVIPQLSDAGAVYRITNDTVCSSYTQGHYTSDLMFSDFNVENINEKRFCEKFITKAQ